MVLGVRGEPKAQTRSHLHAFCWHARSALPKSHEASFGAFSATAADLACGGCASAVCLAGLGGDHSGAAVRHLGHLHSCGSGACRSAARGFRRVGARRRAGHVRTRQGNRGRDDACGFAISRSTRSRAVQDGSAANPPGSAAHGGDFACRSLGHSAAQEHTSELQSRRDLVCRLLLEKKKKKKCKTIIKKTKKKKLTI